LNSDPTERWWKVELDFPPALDEVFGVTNNKQGAMTFRRLASFNWEQELLEDETNFRDLRDRMEADGDLRTPLLDLHKQIRNTVKQVRDRAKQNKQSRGSRYDKKLLDKADKIATGEIDRRTSEGLTGESDRKRNSLTDDQRLTSSVESLTQKGFSSEEAQRLTIETIEAGSKVRWIEAASNAAHFFDVETLPGVVQVVLNSQHPVARELYEVMHDDATEADREELHERLESAAAAFRLLVYSWARLEDEAPSAKRNELRDTRVDWGRYAEAFFTIEDDEF